MMHSKRRHDIAAYASAAELADRFFQCSTWTLCSGFRWGSILLLNDSTSEDALQEYAVVKLTPTDTIPLSGTQIESMTTSWIERDKLVSMLERYEAEGSGIKLGAWVERPHPPEGCDACF